MAAMMTLSERLEWIADTQEEDIRPRLLAALRVGADIALARVSELGGAYPSSSDVNAVRRELGGPSQETHEEEKEEEPVLAAPPDDSPL